MAQRERVLSELFANVLELAVRARKLTVGITIDAEEADRLELSLELYEKLMRDPAIAGWGEFGLVIQAYSKRCLPVLVWLTLLGRELGARIPLRLVKGAYWDSEIKQCQVQGADGYPVYTRKEGTDTSYLACARYLLSEHGIYTKERKIDLAQANWIAENPDEQLSTGLDAEVSYIRRLWIRFFERVGLLTYRAANPIVALYEGNRQRQVLDGAEPRRTRVIPNGIDLDAWAGALERRPPGIPPVVGLVGRVVPIKDVKTFIRAMRGVVSAMPEAEGWIVGPEEEDPDYASECRSLVASLGLQDKVKFLGFRRIGEVLPQLGLMVLTSISEAQPLVILEAWAAGAPVVSSDVGSCRELIEGADAEDRALGRAGEVVAIADPQATSRAILALLRNPQRWQAAQAVGLQRVERYYTEALMLGRYRGLYREATEIA